MSTNPVLKRLPPPAVIHQQMGRLYRELALLRRLMRLSQAAREERGRNQSGHSEAKGVCHVS
jgi:hypothetical protein